MKFLAKEEYNFINGSKKTDINTLFRPNLTKQVSKIDMLEEYIELKS